VLHAKVILFAVT